MLSRFRRWFVDIPIDDQVARHTSLFLQALMLAFLCVLLLGIFLQFVSTKPPLERARTIVLDLLSAFPVVVLVVLVRRGRWRTAMRLFLILCCLLVVLSVTQNGVRDGRAFSHAILPIAIVSVLYRRRWTALVLGGIIGLLGLFALVPDLPHSDASSLSLVIDYAAVAILLAIFLTMVGETYRLVVDNWRSHTEALEREVVQRKLAEAELAQHRDRLEQLVEERTADLKEANQRLLALGRAKDEFVANVSHELRTPLTSVKLFEKLIEMGAPPDPKGYLDSLRRETGRLEHLVESLLLLSRLDANQVQLDLVDVDLNALIEPLINDRAPLAKDRSLSLEVSLAPELPPIKADPRLLEQVLSILLTNAFNYTPPGGVVRVNTHLERNHIRWVGFTVKDTGPGIPLDEQEQLFNRFFRGNTGRRSQVSGTGLGLAIAHEIVARHSGKIEAESKGVLGEGAAFHVSLPANGSTP